MERNWSLEEWVERGRERDVEWAKFWSYTVSSFMSGRCPVREFGSLEVSTENYNALSHEVAYRTWVAWNTGHVPEHYYTTLPVARQMADMVHYATMGVGTVLDPCCGFGSLLFAVEERGYAAWGMENDLAAQAIADLLGHKTYLFDALGGAPWPTEPWDVVVIHPPFIGLRGKEEPWGKTCKAFFTTLLAGTAPIVSLTPAPWWDRVGVGLPNADAWKVVQRGIPVGGIEFTSSIMELILLARA